MKVKMLVRNPDVYLRETKLDIHKIQRNYDRSLHPFEVPREYTRTLNAVKIEKIFAKPFLTSLEGHRDGVECLLKHPHSLSTLLSGAYDGEVRVWDLAGKKCKRIIQAHDGIVRGLCSPTSGLYFFSVGDDKNIKQWNMHSPVWDQSEEPTNTILTKTVMMGIDHHRKDPLFATCGEKVDLWEETRSEPVSSFTWGVDSIHSVKFNPVEVNLMGSTASNRSIILYDIREVSPLRKVILEMRSNTICWNPMEAFVFTACNEDHNLYTFDLRRLKRPLQVHMDHVSAVVDVDYAPTGKEFVAGSYDKTLRIFSSQQGRSREVYHTKRMQRLTAVAWSLDNKYVLGASDEMNIRMWKAKASEKLGVLHHREKAAADYNERLKEQYGHHPEIKRIMRHRHVPKHVYNARREKLAQLQAHKRKEANRRAHSKPGTIPFKMEKEKHVVQEDE